MNDILLAENDKNRAGQTFFTLSRGESLTNTREYKAYLGQYDTFTEYLGKEDSQKDAKACMDFYKFYCVEYNQPIKNIADIHIDRLKKIQPAIKLQPEKINELLGDCRELSMSDLINKVNEMCDKPLMKPKKPQIHQPTFGGSLTSYKEFARELGCAEQSSECFGSLHFHHWPSTKGAGGNYEIPLCAKHHAIAQDLGPAIWFSHVWEALANNFFDPLGKWLKDIK